MKDWQFTSVAVRTALAAGLVFGLSSQTSAETLQEALAAAYLNNPTIRAERASLRATDEGVPAALSGWRPTVTLRGDAGKRRRKVEGSRRVSLTPWTGTLSVTQPLYRGGRTVAGTNQAEALVKAGRASLTNVEQQVLLDGVTAYMDVLRDTARVELNQNNEEVLRRQLDAAQDRFDVGEVTRTDVAQAEARVARAVGDRVSAEGDLASSRATYVRVVGRMPESLQQPPPLPATPTSRDEAVDIALKQNPLVTAARFTEESARHATRSAFGALLPTVSLEASATRSDETTIEDSLVKQESILAQVTVPLYQAGAASAEVRRSKQTESQRLIEIEEASRAAAEQATQGWEDLVAARQRIKSREEEVRANTIALEGVTQEAAVGSRTTLDVLDAEQELLDARVALVIAKRDEYVAGFQLISSLGQLTAEDLGLPVTLYDPDTHYRAVRNKWWGTGTSDER